jgi:hypothetical protein
MSGIMARVMKKCASYDDIDRGDCMQDNTGSLEWVSYFVLVISVTFITLGRTNGRNVIFRFPLS